MRCDACGAENREGTRFCTQCGSSLEKSMTDADETVIEMPVCDKGRKKRKWLFACGIVLMALLCGAGGYFYKAKQEKRAYDQYMRDARSFVEKGDYESAKDSYYFIINRFPEKTEPYVGLLNICILQDDFEEAEKVIRQAEMLCKDKVIKHATSEGESFEKQLTELKHTVTERQEEMENAVTYTWHVEPTIEADNIDYATDAGYYEKSLNEMGRQYSSPYAVIQKGDSLGLIDMEGSLKADMQYESIVNYVGDYCLVKKGAKDAQDTYVIPPSDDDDDEMIPIWDWLYDYVVYNWYYHDGVHEVHEDDAPIRLEEFPPAAFPIRRSEDALDDEGKNWEKQLSGSLYAICRGDELATDFIYEECGVSSCGVMAVCQNGKWGYVNESGETVIPMEYDPSWKYYYDPLKQCKINFEDTGKIFPEKMQKYCYAASEGYIPLCKDGVWEMRDTSGKIAIPAGTFEEIRPFYNGKCWVKQDGKWGVIEIQEEDAEESADTGDCGETSADKTTQKTYKEIYAPVLQEIDEAYKVREISLDYALYDIDKDGVKELIAGTGYYEGGLSYDVYTIKDGKSVMLGYVTGSWSELYEDETGGTGDYIIMVQAYSGFEDISYISIEDGEVKQEYVSSEELSEEEDYYSNDYPIAKAGCDDYSLLEEDIGF